MPLSSQQHADELLRHWQLLWPLPASERIRRIDELTKDYEYRETLEGVREAMMEVA